ncbi:carbon-nitrogen hydrolase family protein [Parafrigoribacterium soli]|uniref:carbon-nitrogen hydrolase family protein n=1 Tax=Parafrigoribacterium soli TaxID=3144663 RepID=UPI0032ED39A9
MRLGLAQLDSGTDKARNLATIERLARRAAHDGAELVAFPEYSMYEKKVVDASFGPASEPLDGPFVTALADLASSFGVAIVAGVVEANPDGRRPFNTLVALDSSGSLLGRYRKIHLFDSYGFRESESITPSPSLEPITFVVGSTTVGLMTCYDLRFPELARELADAGAEVMLACSSWVPGEGKAEHWRVLAQARAIENSCFVGAVSQVPPVSIGRSLLVDPAGGIRGELGLEVGVRTFDLDRADVGAARERDPALENRRYSIRRGRP